MRAGKLLGRANIASLALIGFSRALIILHQHSAAFDSYG